MMPEDPLEDEVGSMAMVVPGAAEVPGATVDASELLYEIMKAALGAMEWVLTNGMDRMAPMLCSVVQTLLSRLQVCKEITRANAIRGFPFPTLFPSLLLTVPHCSPPLASCLADRIVWFSPAPSKPFPSHSSPQPASDLRPLSRTRD